MVRILIHARSATKRHTSYRNWPIDSWLQYVQSFKRAEFISVGSKSESVHIDGTKDMRGIDTEQLIELMRKSDVLVSPSSGTAHLASLCGLPHIVWTDKKHHYSIGGTNRDRYETIWNPYNTRVCVIDEYGWQPPINVVVKKTAAMLAGQITAIKNKRVDNAKQYPAIAMVTYERPSVFKDTVQSLSDSHILPQKVYIFDDNSKDLIKQAELRNCKRKKYNVFINSRRLNVYWNTLFAIDAIYNLFNDKILIYSQDDVKFSEHWHSAMLNIIEEIQTDGVDWGILVLWNKGWEIDGNYKLFSSGHTGGVCWAVRREMWEHFRRDNNIYEKPLKPRIADYQIAHWMHTNGKREWALCCVRDSLVQHTGKKSTITTGRDMGVFKGINFIDK